MNVLAVHDTTGRLLMMESGTIAPKEPVGVPFIWVEVPEGKMLESINVSTKPATPIFIDLPISDSVRISELEETVANLLMGGEGGV